MIGLYRTLFLPGLLVLAPRYLARMAKRGGYTKDWPQRFGRYPVLLPKPPGVRRLWFQAVSVGEVRALQGLFAGLAEDPRFEVILTTTTSTGYEVARQLYPDQTRFTGIFPIDFAPWSQRAWQAFDPDVAILMEGELWPEHLHQARQRNVPTVLLNARLSDRSFRRYQKFPALTRWLLGHLDHVLASSDDNAERFRDLGIPTDHIQIFGNLKFDSPPPPQLDPTQHQQLLADLGLPESPNAGPLVLGSSTWPGEETALLTALRSAREAKQPFRLLLVPRHAERREEIRKLLADSNVTYHFRTEGAAPQPVDVAVADTTGELATLTALADLVVVGKSFPPHTEGQTPLEAAALGKPILFGPGMANFREAAQGLLAAQGASLVATTDDLPAVITDLLADAARCLRMGNAARALHEANRGAASQTLRFLRTHFYGNFPSRPG